MSWGGCSGPTAGRSRTPPSKSGSATRAEPAGPSGRSSERDVESSRQRSRFDPIRRFEPNGHGGALAQVADLPIEAIALVQRLASHVHLGDKLAPAWGLDREVDMRRAPGIGHRLDGAEPIRAVRIGDGPAIALEGAV